MAKTKAPLFGFDGSGQIGEALVFGNWRGIGYARRYVKPSNPRSVEQQKTRNVFTYLEDSWKNAPATLRAPWELYAKGRPFVGRNAWVGQNIRAIRGASDLSAIVISPSANGGVRPESITVSAGAGSITVDVTLPPMPTGWTLDNAHAVALEDQDPQQTFAGDVFAGSDNGSPPSITITGLTTGTAYRVGAFLEFTKADGKKAYGASVLDVATPT